MLQLRAKTLRGSRKRVQPVSAISKHDNRLQRLTGLRNPVNPVQTFQRRLQQNSGFRRTCKMQRLRQTPRAGVLLNEDVVPGGDQARHRRIAFIQGSQHATFQLGTPLTPASRHDQGVAGDLDPHGLSACPTGEFNGVHLHAQKTGADKNNLFMRE